jgi:hypothetical protein
MSPSMMNNLVRLGNRAVSPSQGEGLVIDVFPGRCPGLICCGPFGARNGVAQSQQFSITFPIAWIYLVPRMN